MFKNYAKQVGNNVVVMMASVAVLEGVSYGARQVKEWMENRAIKKAKAESDKETSKKKLKAKRGSHRPTVKQKLARKSPPKKNGYDGPRAAIV